MLFYSFVDTIKSYVIVFIYTMLVIYFLRCFYRTENSRSCSLYVGIRLFIEFLSQQPRVYHFYRNNSSFTAHPRIVYRHFVLIIISNREFTNSRKVILRSHNWELYIASRHLLFVVFINNRKFYRSSKVTLLTAKLLTYTLTGRLKAQTQLCEFSIPCTTCTHNVVNW